MTDRREEHHVFVSYSSRDRAAAEVIREGLERRGLRCWIAPRDIRPGADWSEEILEAIEQTGLMLLVVSANANASNQIKREVERAVNRGTPILPLRIEDVTPARSLEYFISTSHWMDAIEPPLEPHCDRLATAIRSLLGARVAEPPPPMARHRVSRTLARIRIPANWRRPDWLNSRSLVRRLPLRWSPGVAMALMATAALVAAVWILRGSAPGDGAAPSASAVAAATRQQPARYRCKKGFQFDVSPDDATVILDGRSIGTVDDWDEGPFAASPGRHTVRLSKREYRGASFDVEITDNGRFNYCLIRIELTEID